MNNIIIGTAGWRSKYGNNNKILTIPEINKLISFLGNNNLFHFDTAQAYGDSENILLNSENYQLIIDSKISEFKNSRNLQNYLNQFSSNNLRSIYFHDHNILKKHKSNEINKYINLINRKNLLAGFSLYDINQLDEAIKLYGHKKIIFQVPCNIFDLRFLRYIKGSNYANERISFRSLFARGLIFMPGNQSRNILIKHNNFIKEAFNNLFALELNEENLKKLTFSLIAFLIKKNYKIVIGINSQKEYHQLFEGIEQYKDNIDWHQISSAAENLLNMENLSF